MTYLDCLKNEISYKYLNILLIGLTFAFASHSNKEAKNTPLNMFLVCCATGAGILLVNAYSKYKKIKTNS